MKALVSILAMSLMCLSAQADIAVKNSEYAAQAKQAAKTVFELNWESTNPEQFEVIEEDFFQDPGTIYGNYKVRVFTLQDGQKKDRGIDLNVHIYGNAVLEVKVDCRLCE